MTDDTSTPTQLRRTARCPECRRRSSHDHFPFCSERCKAVDLNRWLQGAYVIPGPSLSSDDEDR